MNAAVMEVMHQGIAIYAVPPFGPATTTFWASTAGRARVHAYQLTSPCRLPLPDDQNNIIFADASGTMNLTPAAGGTALELLSDAAGELWQHHLMRTTIFRASLHSDLETLAIIVDAVTTVFEAPQDQPHHVWVVIDAAVDFQIVQRRARQPLHKATNSCLGTQALHLWEALRNLPGHIVLHCIKQDPHRYNLGNRHIDLHAHNQIAEHVPTPTSPRYTTTWTHTSSTYPRSRIPGSCRPGCPMT